ncbi:MAG TPA: hypothetical protein VMM18_08355 [Gemmatimonadaceae bacterium]|nr:hypothetical protein [Gemmatimonadaceae bacterium]
MKALLLGTLVLLPTWPGLAAADAIPHFARKYGVACSRCHVSPPKLNEFGEAFVARGYEMPGLTARPTWPFALWVSGRSESLPLPEGAADDVRAYLNRVEFISGGKVVAPWLSYFIEWRPVSQEARSDGTLRDRSGRFEDLFITASGERVELTLGQFRQIAQVDVSRRLGLSEPLVLSSSLAGSGGGSARERSLRGFSPGGRAPAVRAAWNQPLAGAWRWSTSVGLPVSGELSIPLTREARVEASNEIEWRPKGIVVESFARRGLASFGGHVFVDDSRRYLVQGIVTGSRSSVHWAAIAGVARTGELVAGRWSLETEYLPSPFLGVGGRVEDRAADGANVAVLPYLNAQFPGTRYTIRLTIERRFQRGRNATLVELGTVF